MWRKKCIDKNSYYIDNYGYKIYLKVNETFTQDLIASLSTAYVPTVDYLNPENTSLDCKNSWENNGLMIQVLLCNP